MQKFDEKTKLKRINEIEADFKEIKQGLQSTTKTTKSTREIKLRIPKEQYYTKVAKVIEHIKRGDIYEANYCQEFYAENTTIDPFEVYAHLNDISTPPFGAFLKMDAHYVLSASPERYLKKEDNTVISQPIKGNAKSVTNNMDHDDIAVDL